jgi:putative transposase
VLKAGGQLIHRQKFKLVRQQQKPQAFIATRPSKIYSCDITYLPTLKRGMFFYVYLVLDIDSRKIVGWQDQDCESSALAAEMMIDICHREGVVNNQVTLHSGNGGSLKGATMLATLQELGG